MRISQLDLPPSKHDGPRDGPRDVPNPSPAHHFEKDLAQRLDQRFSQYYLSGRKPTKTWESCGVRFLGNRFLFVDLSKTEVGVRVRSSHVGLVHCPVIPNMWVCLQKKGSQNLKIQWFLIMSPIQMVILEYTQYTPFPTKPFHPAALDHVACDLSHTAQQTFFRYHLWMNFMAVAAAICTASTYGKEDAWPAASLIVGPRALGCICRALGCTRALGCICRALGSMI